MALLLITLLSMGVFGVMAYYFDVEEVMLIFGASTFNLTLDYEGEYYDGEIINWETPEMWCPGDEADLEVSLHMEGQPAKSVVVHFDVKVRENDVETEPERLADPTGWVNDLDSVIQITSAMLDGIDLLPALITQFDWNMDGELKLSELDCYQWDLCEKAGLPELTPSTWYYLSFTFKFQETAGNEYQGDKIVTALIFSALQEQWTGVGGPQEKPWLNQVALVEKDTTTWQVVFDGAMGELFYNPTWTANKSACLLMVKDLDPDSWYLVSFTSYDTDTGNLLGQIGYYGFVPKTNWADVALFKTDANGNAQLLLPSDARNPDGTIVVDPVHGPLVHPGLLSGNYVDVTIAVKYISTGPIDWGVMVGGGTAVLFEYEAISFTIP